LESCTKISPKPRRRYPLPGKRLLLLASEEGSVLVCKPRASAPGSQPRPGLGER